MVVIIMLLFVLFFVFSFASFAAVCFARKSLRRVSSTQLYSGFGKKMTEFPVKVLHPTHSLTYTISDTHSVTYSLIYVIIYLQNVLNPTDPCGCCSGLDYHRLITIADFLTHTHSLIYSLTCLFAYILFSCCKSYHDHGTVAPTPIQVVRSRFCAFKYNKLDYIIATTAPTHQVLTHSL